MEIKRYNRKIIDKMIETGISKHKLFKLYEKQVLKNSQYLDFDYALPQKWLNHIIKNYDIDYNLLKLTTVWSYKENRIIGKPLSICQEIQEQLDAIHRFE